MLQAIFTQPKSTAGPNMETMRPRREPWSEAKIKTERCAKHLSKKNTRADVKINLIWVLSIGRVGVIDRIGEIGGRCVCV